MMDQKMWRACALSPSAIHKLTISRCFVSFLNFFRSCFNLCLSVSFSFSVSLSFFSFLCLSLSPSFSVSLSSHQAAPYLLLCSWFAFQKTCIQPADLPMLFISIALSILCLFSIYLCSLFLSALFGHLFIYFQLIYCLSFSTPSSLI